MCDVYKAFGRAIDLVEDQREAVANPPPDEVPLAFDDMVRALTFLSAEQLATAAQVSRHFQRAVPEAVGERLNALVQRSTRSDEDSDESDLGDKPEVGRAADGLGHHRVDRGQRHLRGLAGRDLGLRLGVNGVGEARADGGSLTLLAAPPMYGSGVGGYSQHESRPEIVAGALKLYVYTMASQPADEERVRLGKDRGLQDVTPRLCYLWVVQRDIIF